MVRPKPKRRYNKYAVIIDGHMYSACFLGKGQFSNVYRVGDRAVYYTKDDCTKEVLAMYYRGGVPHLPEIIRHDDIVSGRTRYQVFSSPIYRNVKRTDASAYRLMREIIKVHNIFWRTRNERQYNYYLMQEFANYVESQTQLPRSVGKALHELTNIVANCGYTVSFDIEKRNFGVNDYGTLIFRDIVFVIDRLH